MFEWLPFVWLKIYLFDKDFVITASGQSID